MSHRRENRSTTSSRNPEGRWMDIPECGRIRYTVEKPSRGCPALLTAYAPEGWLWGGHTPSLVLVGRTENHAVLELENIIADSWPLQSLAWSTPEAVELFGCGGGDPTGEQDELPF